MTEDSGFYVRDSARESLEWTPAERVLLASRAKAEAGWLESMANRAKVAQQGGLCRNGVDCPTGDPAPHAHDSIAERAAQEYAKHVQLTSEHRATVARQQSELLNAMAADAVAPAVERAAADATLAGQGKWRLQYDPGTDLYRAVPTHVSVEPLQRQVRWLQERGDHHAKLIGKQQIALHEAEKTVSALITRINELEAMMRTGRVYIGGCPQTVQYRDKPTYPGTQEFSGTGVSVMSAGSISGARIDELRVADVEKPAAKAAEVFGLATANTLSVAEPKVYAGCEHDLHKANTTVSAITRKKARCNVCAHVWEMP
jgi:hypothetical protein